MDYADVNQTGYGESSSEEVYSVRTSRSSLSPCCGRGCVDCVKLRG